MRERGSTAPIKKEQFSGVTLIVNPNSGREKVLRNWRRYKRVAKAERVFREKFHEVTTHFTHSVEDTKRLSKEAIKHPRNLVVVFGGDGTLGSIINALLMEQTERKIAEGTIVPLPSIAAIRGGSESIGAKAFGMPNSVKKAAKEIIRGKPKAIDVGVVRKPGEPDSHIFLNTGIGLDALILNEMQKKPERVTNKKKKKRNNGRLAYVQAAKKAREKHQGYDLTIQTNEGKEHKIKKAAVVIFQNMGKKYGGVFHLAQSNPADGKIELIGIDKRGLTLRRIFPRLVTQGKMKKAIYDQSASYTIRSKDRMAIQGDGEILKPSNEITIFVKPKAINAVIATKRVA